jgi:hypothetical protein
MGLLDDLLMCGEHNCPMIEIDGDYRCVIEHTDDLIGAQQIVDVVPTSGDEPAELVFANGRKLPLICSCCGLPLQYDDPDQLREVATGLYLVGLRYLPPEEDETECLEFIFAPALSDELPDEAQAVMLHLDSVRGIR